MNTQTNTQPHLTAKLAEILSDVDQRVQEGQLLNFGMLRNLLGQKRVMILPSVKNYTEHPAPNDQSRVTVILEISLLDGESDEQIVSRWVGQAVDSPEVCYERAITRALEDFLQKTFLLMTPCEPPSVIRRKPHGASDAAPVAVVPTASQQSMFGATNAVDTPQIQPASQSTTGAKQASTVTCFADQKSWKAANALWRALVAEVCSADVMAALEVAMEQQEGVDSWKKISPDTIRQWCVALRRRSSMGSDVRKISDREEYILSQLSRVPKGSSLARIEEEMRRLLMAVVSVEETTEFLSLYIQKMNVSGLDEVAGRALIAMCRKLRRLKDEERASFVLSALDARQAA